MANDIIGAPEVFTIKGRMFYFSPLSDYASCAVDSWLRWSTDGKHTSVSTTETHEILQQPAGAAILLFWSIRDLVRWNTLKCARFVGGSQAVAKEIYDAWAMLNLDGYYAQLARYKSSSPKSETKSERNPDEAVYYDLAEKHGYTLHEIRSMTKVQQTLLWLGEPGIVPTITHATSADYLEWNANRARQ